MFGWLNWFRQKKEYVYLIIYFDFAHQRSFTSIHFSDKPMNTKKYPSMSSGYFSQIKLIFIYNDEYVKEEIEEDYYGK